MRLPQTRLLVAALALLLVIAAAGAAHAHDTSSEQRECRLCRVSERPGTEPAAPSVSAPVYLPTEIVPEAPPTRIDLDPTCPVGRRGPPSPSV